LYKQVLEISKTWKSENLMYVVGATKAEYFTEIRKIVPDSFLLVPGWEPKEEALRKFVSTVNDNIGLSQFFKRNHLCIKGTDYAEKAGEALKCNRKWR
jgi:orotidine-5'-phosphate decarboxylase